MAGGEKGIDLALIVFLTNSTFFYNTLSPEENIFHTGLYHI